MIKQWIQKRRERRNKRHEERRIEAERKEQELNAQFQTRATELEKIILDAGMVPLGWISRNRSDRYVEVYALLDKQMFQAQLTLKGGLVIKKVGGDQ